jgi:hypothetical protein
MSQLQFRFGDLLGEIQTLRAISEPFLAPESRFALGAFEDSLENIGNSQPGSAHRWDLKPLWTRVSEGEYEAGDRRGHERVVGCVSGNWDVTPLGSASKKTKGKTSRLIQFSGIASTRVEIFTEDRQTRLAMWRVELGDAASPGCYFHVQVLGEDVSPPFPKSLPIPRLPSLFVSPLAVTEYLFGELFQDAWGQTAASGTDDIQRWSNFQRQRFKRVLDFHQMALASALASPWISLKKGKPEPAHFLT